MLLFEDTVGLYFLSCLCEMLGEVLLYFPFGFLSRFMLVFPLGFLLECLWNLCLGICLDLRPEFGGNVCGNVCGNDCMWELSVGCGNFQWEFVVGIVCGNVLWEFSVGISMGISVVLFAGSSAGICLLDFMF